MLVSPCVPVFVLTRGRQGIDVRFAKILVLGVLILADMTLGLGTDCTTEGSLKFDWCGGGGRHERAVVDSNGCFKGCLCLSRDDRRASVECRMTLEAEDPNKKGWVERTEAAKSTVDIDRGG